jgi:hypothetical protein
MLIAFIVAFRIGVCWGARALLRGKIPSTRIFACGCCFLNSSTINRSPSMIWPTGFDAVLFVPSIRTISFALNP